MSRTLTRGPRLRRSQSDRPIAITNIFVITGCEAGRGDEADEGGQMPVSNTAKQALRQVCNARRNGRARTYCDARRAVH